MLETLGLTLKFGGLKAVNEVDLKIEDSKIVSLIGPNGAGKTSLFNLVSGIYEPSSGRVLIGEKEIVRDMDLRVLVGFVLVGLITAFGLTLAVNCEALWEVSINANYIYQQSFPWKEALVSVFQYFRNEFLEYTLLPGIVGMILGGFGARAVFQQGRRSPDLVAEQGVARTFQNIHLFQEMTVLENVLVGQERLLKEGFWEAALRLPAHYREKKESAAKAHQYLKFVELDSYANQRASSLSYGHQRRLEIARALALEPKLILLDEPAAGMNPTEAQELMQLIRKIKEKDITIFLIEHHMKVVMEISEKVIVLDYGVKIAEGTPQEVKINPKVIEAYLGTSNE